MIARILLSLIMLSSIGNFSLAQRSIGKVSKQQTKSSRDTLDIPVEQWIGRKFILLEKPKLLQKHGYDLHLNKDFYSFRSSFDPDLEVETTYNLLYSRFFGKTITVAGIEEGTLGPIITFIEDSTKRALYASAYKGNIDGIALYDDLARGKSRWLGKTIYAKRRSITTYDADSDQYGSVNVKIGTPLKVTDIWWGFDSVWPLWLIVQTPQGDKGFISTKFSWTDVYSDWWNDERPWQDDFFEFNPRQKYQWTEEIWRLIDAEKVRIGMTKDQVILSWGKPKDINKDIHQTGVHEQWIYESQYLYFEDGKLTSMQSR